MQLTGTFSITDWQETPQKTLPQGSKLNNAIVKQAYSGDIAGTSEVYYQLHYTDNNNAWFNGFEYLSGIINDQPCELVLDHNGQFSDGVASAKFRVISCEPLSALVGASGHFSASLNGQTTYTLSTAN
ncbi:DUF3224 domain-containing protein [Alteromonas gilva]|uniref:DUF3224 domain-containing protein n=1 Tax=Alteromonas gilva TaxID=2987522 RepID=A0ABT5KXI4_9ALTE|nr:DUF3224 domain-containing protein [Alteromonas gilva]MDC8829475.1 DUF3224 domain-containing protein [Alteromonas gilva]